MAKKPKRKSKKKEESLIEQRIMNFAEEIEAIAERFGKRMERRGKKLERECESWWFTTFGFIGPIMGSIFGVVFLAFGIWMLNLINLPLGSNFISALSSFIFRNLHWFFGAFIFFGYSDYFSKRFSKTYWIVSPAVNGIGVVIVTWISVWILNLINAFADSNLIASVSNFLYVNLWDIFILFLVLGYVFVFIKILFMKALRGFK